MLSSSSLVMVTILLGKLVGIHSYTSSSRLVGYRVLTVGQAHG